MDNNSFINDFRQLWKLSQNFLRKYENEAIELITSEEITAEENLQIEILVELMDHIYGICRVWEYSGKTIKKEGKLDLNEKGEIILNGEILPFMTELEVFVYDENRGQNVWTRALIGGLEERYLVGVGADQKIKGITARIRGRT